MSQLYVMLFQFPRQAFQSRFPHSGPKTQAHFSANRLKGEKQLPAAAALGPHAGIDVVLAVAHGLVLLQHHRLAKIENPRRRYRSWDRRRRSCLLLLPKKCEALGFGEDLVKLGVGQLELACFSAQM